MKLRNKKTGEIVTKIDVSQDHEGIWVLENIPRFYRSLAELNEEWEDYEPKEPLIEDEKIRKAVRVWAEANDMSSDSVVICGSFDDGFETDTSSIEFDCTIRDALRGIKRGKSYTIAELCGEEE